MDEKFEKTIREIYDNVSIGQLTHLPDRGTYNHEYYKGFMRDGHTENDLLYAESDGIYTTEWFLVKPHAKIYIGYSYCFEDVIHVEFEKQS